MITNTAWLYEFDEQRVGIFLQYTSWDLILVGKAYSKECIGLSHGRACEERRKLPTWLFESCEDGLSAGVLGICELHHTVVISLVEAKHSAGVIRFCKGRAKK